MQFHVYIRPKWIKKIFGPCFCQHPADLLSHKPLAACVPGHQVIEEQISLDESVEKLKQMSLRSTNGADKELHAFGL